jgi:hypothetical protein
LCSRKLQLSGIEWIFHSLEQVLDKFAAVFPLCKAAEAQGWRKKDLPPDQVVEVEQK